MSGVFFSSARSVAVSVAPPPPPPLPPPPRQVVATVASVTYERVIHTESLRAFEERGRSVPEGGRLLAEEQVVDHYKDVQTGTRTVTKTRAVQTGTHSVTKTRRVQTGTRRVKVGTRSMRNGFFQDVYQDQPVYGTQSYTVQEPVYGTQTYTVEEPVYEKRPVLGKRYTYEISRWTPGADLVARADGVMPPWPETSSGPADRASGRSERALVRLVADSSETFEREEQENPTRFVPGARVTLTVDPDGRVLSIADVGGEVAAQGSY